MEDSWKLKELFKFDTEHLKIRNDSNKPYKQISEKGIPVFIEHNNLIRKNPNPESYLIPNYDTINLTDKKIVKTIDFKDNLNLIIRQLLKPFIDGQIKKGLEQIEFHYQYTKRKKDFLLFIKYYFISEPSPSHDIESAKGLSTWIIKDWIDEKRNKSDRLRNYIILLILSLILILGLIFLTEYRSIIFGAVIGLVIGELGKVTQQIRKNKSS